MKQQFISLILFVLLIGCSQKDNFVVEGTIDDATGKTLVLYRMDLDKDVAIDSITFKKRKSFKFKMEQLKEPTFFKLKLSSGGFITLLGDTTEHINIKAKASTISKNYEVTNSVGSGYVKYLNAKINFLRSKVDSINNYYKSISKEERELQIDNLSNQILDYLNKHKKMVGEFVMDNPRSFASYYALFLTLSDETMVLNVMDKNDQVYFATIATSLNMLYPESPRVRQLYDYVLKAKAEKRKARIMEIIANAEGSGLPDIKEKDINGKEVSLSSLKGKVVVLSFWASWDKNSRLENQNLKKVYKKYKGKGIEIFQVGLERSRVLWESAISQDEIDWISVTDLKYTESIHAKIFNIQQLPANYIISRDGEIIGKDLFGNRLDEKLKEIL